MCKDSFMITDILFDHHRNGISGKGFYVCRFINHEDGNATPMVAVLFPTGEDEAGLPTFQWEDGCECAVFNQTLLGQGEIEFGYNSFRGDYFSFELAEHIRKTIAERRASDDAYRWPSPMPTP